MQLYAKAAELGFEYVVVDAGWEVGFPAFGFADPFAALAELVGHGHRDGREVDIIVWKPASEIQDDSFRDFFFQKLSEAGASGVNIVHRWSIGCHRSDCVGDQS